MTCGGCRWHPETGVKSGPRGVKRITQTHRLGGLKARGPGGLDAHRHIAGGAGAAPEQSAGRLG